MTELLRAVKADLTSRRMLPLLVVAALALLAAGAYALTAGGGASKTPPPSAPVAAAPPVEGPAVSAAPANPNAALAETTSGAAFQHGGNIHNPFKPLPGTEEPAASGATGASAGGGGSSSTSSGSGASGSGSAGSAATSGSGSGEAPSGAEGTSSGSEGSGSEGNGNKLGTTVYSVSLKVQRVSESGAPIGKAQRFAGLERLSILPSRKLPLLAYLGVTGTGEAVFALLQPMILHGSAKCVPGPANCEGIELKAQKSEELQYLKPNGEVVAYELKVTSIQRTATTAKAAEAAHRRISKSGSDLVRKLKVTMPAPIHFSNELGVVLGVSKAIAQAGEGAGGPGAAGNAKAVGRSLRAQPE